MHPAVVLLFGMGAVVLIRHILDAPAKASVSPPEGTRLPVREAQLVSEDRPFLKGPGGRQSPPVPEPRIPEPALFHEERPHMKGRGGRQSPPVPEPRIPEPALFHEERLYMKGRGGRQSPAVPEPRIPEPALFHEEKAYMKGRGGRQDPRSLPTPWLSVIQGPLEVRHSAQSLLPDGHRTFGDHGLVQLKASDLLVLETPDSVDIRRSSADPWVRIHVGPSFRVAWSNNALVAHPWQPSQAVAPQGGDVIGVEDSGPSLDVLYYLDIQDDGSFRTPVGR